MKFCSKCGAELKDGMKFCGGCGAPVESNEQPAGMNGAVPNNAMQNGMPNNGGMPNGGAMPNGMPNNAMPNNGMPNNGMPYQQGMGYPQQGMPMQGGAAAAPKKPNPVGVFFKKIIDTIKAKPIIGIIAGAALVVIIALIIILANVFKYQRIDAKDLFKFEFEGINNYGSATGELNCYDEYVYSSWDTAYLVNDKLGKALDDYGLSDLYDSDSESGNEKETVSPYFSTKEDTMLDAWSKAKDRSEAAQMRNALLKTNKNGNYVLKCKFENNKNLKNGDKVKVTVVYDEDYLKNYKIKLTNTEFEIEVKNLDEGEEFDPFSDKNFEVTFSGIDGQGEMDYDRVGDNDFFSYYADKEYNLTNGEKVTVTASCYYTIKKAGDKYYFEDDGKYYVVEGETMAKEYEVTGLTEVQAIDPFKDITFQYSGGTPFLDVDSVVTDNCDQLVKDNVRFEIVNGESLSAGSKFTVKARDSWNGLADEGYKLAGTADSDGYVSKEFTVDDTCPAYVTAENGEAAYESIQSKVDDEIQDMRKDLKGSSYVYGADVDGKIESITSFDKVDTYVAFTKKTNADSLSWGEAVNEVLSVYKIEVKTDGDKGKDTFYAVIYATNFIYDGKTYTSGDISSDYYDTMDDIKKDVLEAEGYTVTKCGESAATDATETTTTTTTTAAKSDDSTASTEKSDEKATTTTKKTAESSEIVP